MTTGATVASLTVPKGDVVRTSPPAGTTEPLNTPISLVVSGGGVKVPYLLTDTQAVALSTLSAENLVPNFITQAPQAGSAFPPGTVWRTVPGPARPCCPANR